MLLPILAAFFLLGASASASEESPENYLRFQNGHNLSSTSDLLPPGHCSIGIPVTACGLFRGLSLGTSPWMYMDYNMFSIALRALIAEDEEQNRWAAQGSYFKTYEKREAGNRLALSTYQMEAAWLMLIRTWRMSEHYRLHGNLHANYYFDEKLPFSLRRPYARPSPFQFNLTLLHQMDLVSGWFVFGEMGLLDFARAPLHIHAGASLGKQIGGLSARAGFSLTGSGPALFSPTNRRDYQQALRFQSIEGYDGEIDPWRAQYDYAIHPEFSLQYTF